MTHMPRWRREAAAAMRASVAFALQQRRWLHWLTSLLSAGLDSDLMLGLAPAAPHAGC